MNPALPQPSPQWHVQYREGSSDHVVMNPTPEAAIVTACQLIDQGREVYGIGTGPLTDAIGAADIARIYLTWKAVKGPRSARSTRPQSAP